EVRDPAGHPLGQTRIARYRFGSAEVVAVLQESLEVATLYGRDGVTVYDDARLGRVARSAVEIHLPRQAQVTDVRTGQGLGRTDTVRPQLRPGEAVVLALNAEMPRLTVTAAPSAARGEPAVFTLQLDRPGPHLVRCHVLSPEGRFLPEYAANVLVD